jgi:hypothetical protein
MPATAVIPAPIVHTYVDVAKCWVYSSVEGKAQPRGLGVVRTSGVGFIR